METVDRISPAAKPDVLRARVCLGLQEIVAPFGAGKGELYRCPDSVGWKGS